MDFSLLLFVLIIHGGLSTVTRVHVIVYSWKQWDDAQSFCRQNYKDLSTVSSTEENDRLRRMLGTEMHAWIGMHRNESNLDQFIWSDGDSQANLTYWKSNQPDDKSNNQNCVETDGTGWADYNCAKILYFFCYSLTLVRDQKTWDEAIEYCRDHYTNLATLTTDEQLQNVKRNLQGETTIWIGLRFIVGKWYWMSFKSVGLDVSLPDCPDQPYRCGALNVMTEKWENRDCEEKFNFLCF